MSPEPIFRPSNFKASVQYNIAGREKGTKFGGSCSLVV